MHVRCCCRVLGTQQAEDGVCVPEGEKLTGPKGRCLNSSYWLGSGIASLEDVMRRDRWTMSGGKYGGTQPAYISPRMGT